MNIDYEIIDSINKKIIDRFKNVENEKNKIYLENEKIQKEFIQKISIFENQIEMNKKLFDSLSLEISKLIKENAYIKEHSVPIKEYLTLMKLNEKLLFELLNKEYLEQEKATSISEEKKINFLEEEEKSIPQVEKTTLNHELSEEEIVSAISAEEWLNINEWLKKNTLLNQKKLKRYSLVIVALSHYKRKGKNPSPGELYTAKDIYNILKENGYYDVRG